MNRKLGVLGGSNLREKIARFLFERQDESGKITGKLSREEMADYLHAARPSISRELGKMQKCGILSLENNEIKIINQEKFEAYL